MSGYGMPQGQGPASPRSGRSGPALPVLELVGVGLALLAFIIAFLAWAKQNVPDGVSVDGISFSGWDLPLPTAGVTLLLVAALLTAAPLFTKRESDTVSPVPAMLAVLGAVLLIIFAIVGYADGFDRGIGAWLGLVLGIGTAAVLELSWMQRTGRVKKPAPAAGPSNWQGQGQGQPAGQPGQGWGQPGQGQPGGGYPAQQPPYGQQPPAQPQPPSYGQQPTYGGQGGYPGPSTGGQPAQQPAPYGQEHYPPQSGNYPAQPGNQYPQG